MKALLTAFLIAHGLVHIPLPIIPGTDGKLGNWLMDPARSWPLKALGAGEMTMRLTGSILVALAALAFLIAALAHAGFLVPAAWFRAAALTGSVISLIWLGLFWHPWLVVGTVLDLAIVAAVILKWTPAVR